MEYVRKPQRVKAIQWYPDPELGRFEGKRYHNHRVGYDSHGVEYTIVEVGLRVPGIGFYRLIPGDWIVKAYGKTWVVEQELFPILYGEVPNG